MTGFRAALVMAALVIVTGCAARRPAPPPVAPAPPRVDDLTALIEQGCYRCLERAYEQGLARGAAQHAFESAVLLTVRSKELGLPFSEWLARAREAAPDGPAAALYLTIADALPPDRLSEERYTLFETGMRNVRSSVAEWRDELRSGPGSELFRSYLELALVCAFGRVGENAQSYTGEIDPLAAVPLYQYAVGICDASKAPRLQVLRAANDAFVDADYALGRFLIEDPTSGDQEGGLRRLQSAAAAFPESAAMRVWIANTHRSWEEWAPALESYDAALALSPKHPDALIGRTIALSQLGRAQDAITTATTVIDGGQWMVGEAYYWRAWNRLRLGNLTMAREDADRALTQMANARVFVLSGVVEWRMRRLESAERDFQRAVTIDFGECEGAFDLGIVRDELGQRAESLAAFRQAGQCNDLSIKLRRETIAKIEAGPGTFSSRARDAARHQRALHELEERRDEIIRAISALEKAQPHEGAKSSNQGYPVFVPPN
jgi:tetratricopeptide (TPR) repeat protein